MADGLGATLHREPRRLVEDQHLVVLEQHQAARQLGVAVRDPLALAHRRSLGQRRHTDHGAGDEAAVGLDPAPVDTQLAPPRQLVNLGLAEVGPAPAQPAVQAHAVLRLGDGDQLDLTCPSGGRRANDLGTSAHQARRATTDGRCATTAR